MAERSGIFEGSDPIAIFRRWMAEAEQAEPNDPNAIALASVDSDGLPNVRMVLLKEIEDDAFVFYTNYDGTKGQELIASGKAAFVCHWKSLRRQVRVRGLVSKEEGPQADAYYASRAYGSRIGAWASPQSKPIASRGEVLAQVAKYTAKFVANPPRPPHWGGFRIKPLEIELWSDGEFRLHDRFRWVREGNADAWRIDRLAP